MAACMVKLSAQMQKKFICSRIASIQGLYRYSSAETQNVLADPYQSDSEESLYPEIKPEFPPGKWGDIERPFAWHLHGIAEDFKNVPTAKQRLEKLAGQDDVWMARVTPYDRVPNTLQFKKYTTNTHIEQGLPNGNSTNLSNELASSVNNLITDSIEEQHESQFKYKYQNNGRLWGVDKQTEMDHDILGKILTGMTSLLAPSFPHLSMTQIDERVRCEASWRRSGFIGKDIPTRGKYLGSIALQLQGMVNWQLRSELPLPEFVDSEDELCRQSAIPDTIYSPFLAGAYSLKGRQANFAGYRIGDPCSFTQLAVLCGDTSGSWFEKRFGKDALKDRDVGAGLALSFALMVAQAHNQGFNHLLDVTYPLSTQLIVSNGRHLRLAAYQLNTLDMWKQKQPDVRNVMWITEETALYDCMEDGKVKGLNEDLCQQLIQMMIREPVQDRQLRPYLPHEKVASYPFINALGEPPIEVPKVGRFELPRYSVYSY